MAGWEGVVVFFSGADIKITSASLNFSDGYRDKTDQSVTLKFHSPETGEPSTKGVP